MWYHVSSFLFVTTEKRLLLFFGHFADTVITLWCYLVVDVLTWKFNFSRQLDEYSIMRFCLFKGTRIMYFSKEVKDGNNCILFNGDTGGRSDDDLEVNPISGLPMKNSNNFRLKWLDDFGHKLNLNLFLFVKSKRRTSLYRCPKLKASWLLGLLWQVLMLLVYK